MLRHYLIRYWCCLIMNDLKYGHQTVMDVLAKLILPCVISQCYILVNINFLWSADEKIGQHMHYTEISYLHIWLLWTIMGFFCLLPIFSCATLTKEVLNFLSILNSHIYAGRMVPGTGRIQEYHWCFKMYKHEMIVLAACISHMKRNGSIKNTKIFNTQNSMKGNKIFWVATRI